MNKPGRMKASEDVAAQDKEGSVVVVSQSSPRHLTKRQALVGGFILLIALLVGGGSLLYKHFHKSDIAVIAAQKRVSEAKSEAVPVQDEAKIEHYAYLAASYYDAEDYPNALDAYLKADTYIKNRNAKVPGSRSVNLGIAQTYAKLGKNDKAREYYEREAKRVQNSGNDELIRYIHDQEGKL